MAYVAGVKEEVGKTRACTYTIGPESPDSKAYTATFKPLQGAVTVDASHSPQYTWPHEATNVCLAGGWGSSHTLQAGSDILGGPENAVLFGGSRQ